MSRSIHSIIKIIFNKLKNILNRTLIQPSLIFKKVFFGENPEVNGIEHIQLGSRFYVRSGLWLDAITHYKGKEFHPVIKIGENFSGSNRIHIAAINYISIGNDCLFGSNILVTDHNHGDPKEIFEEIPPPPINLPLHSTGPILIGDRVWLGDNVTVLAGARIGDDVVIGANSLVRGELPAGYVCAGVPCRPVRKRVK